MLEYLSNKQISTLEDSYVPFLRQVRTATARGTFYHGRAQMEQTAAHLHDAIVSTDRGIYAATLLLDGATDFSRQVGLLCLVTSRPNGQGTFLTQDMEAAVVGRLLSDLRPQKVLSVFLALKGNRWSGQRIKKMMLRYVLGSKALPRWAVTYRRKLRAVLTHAWGINLTCKIKHTLGKQSRTAEDVRLLNRHLWKHANPRVEVDELVRFILGDETSPRADVVKSYVEAKRTLEAGKRLPYEVLEGIRSRYHRDTPKERVLELTADNLTRGQRKAFQRKAEQEGVSVAWNPEFASLVELVLYGYERGFDQVAAYIGQKAEVIRDRIGLNADVIMDYSKSMEGAGTQKMRPRAVAHAMAMCLSPYDEIAPPMPRGDTELASKLVQSLMRQPEAAFILSDGYENAPAGRVAEVIAQVRRLGIQTPIYHINPVSSKEGGRTFDGAVNLAVSVPEALPAALTEGLLQTDVIAGLERMLPKALEVIA